MVVDKLSKSDGKSKLVQTSLPALDTVLAKYLDLAASLWGKLPTEAAISFWKEQLESYPPEKVERAFREYLGSATQDTYPPKPGDIVELIQEYAAAEAPDLVEKVRQQLKG